MAGHTKKSREKLADTLMTMSGALGVAVTAATIVSPIGLIVAKIVGGERFDFVGALARVDPWLWGLLIVFFFGAVSLVMLGRRSAFKIYDEIYPDQ
ncbi:hypothetical protein [Stenotrophomonas pigmentata]|uniref:hypothetical protein n=1 Tax=Stenotrophomonas pigmentata TaxID=3055080 RepID=UPI0026EFE328|nr:hypothetical protein [Stenotrophomonas sp. 610A2]